MRLATAVSAFCLAVCSAPAQQLAPLDDAAFPARAPGTTALAIGDVDGDGRLDLVVAGATAAPRLLLAATSHGFAAAPLAATSTDVRAALLADVDGDGDLDLVLAQARAGASQGRIELWIADSGAFTDASASLPADSGCTVAMAAADVDGDGDVDLLLGHGDDSGEIAQPDAVWINDGTGTFADESAARLPQVADLTTALAAGDVDGDGDVDLVIGNGGWGSSLELQDRLLVNDGQGVFTDVTATALATPAATTRTVLLFDADGDGDLDLFAGHGAGAGGRSDQLLLNDGLGVFADDSSRLPGELLRTTSATAVDADGDGRLDLLLGVDGDRARLYRNLGAGGFVATAVPFDVARTAAVAGFDVDGDSRPDLIAVGDDSAQVLFNAGSSRFVDLRDFAFPANGCCTTQAAWLDADSDGAPDALLAGADAGQAPLQLLHNDRRGGFAVASVAWPPLPPAVTALAVADLSGDGHPDVLLGGNGGTSTLLLGDGAGGFVAAQTALPVTNERVDALTIADIDGDGALDAVLALGVEAHGDLQVWHNDGTGTLSSGAAASKVFQGTAVCLHAADLDGDGDSDLLISRRNAQNGVALLENRSGILVPPPSALPAFAAAAVAIASADLDGDGDLDLVLGHGAGQPLRLLRNDGNLTFTELTAPMLSDVVAVVVADFDLDGDVDVAASDGALLHLLVNDGSGTLVESPSRLAEPGVQSSVLLATDVDGDGDDDLLSAGVQHRLHVNLHRQLHTPEPPIAGTRWPLRLYSRPGYGGGDTAVLVVSLRALASPIPLGTIGTVRIDPTTAVVLPTVAVPAAGATVQLPIPNLLPPLAGTTMWAQAVTLPTPSPATWHLGNLTADSVLR